MRFLSIITFLAGYSLMYASVANGGRFAFHPWYGVFGDAYVEPTSAAATATTTTPAPTTPSSSASPGRVVRGAASRPLVTKRGSSGNLEGFGK